VEATSGAAAVWWWIGLVVLYFVVIPVILTLSHRLLRQISEINRYAEDVLEHGLGITANLEPVPALLETRELVKSVGARLGTYAQAVDKIL
jgi:hypothetical protein